MSATRAEGNMPQPVKKLARALLCLTKKQATCLYQRIKDSTERWLRAEHANSACALDSSTSTKGRLFILMPGCWQFAPNIVTSMLPPLHRNQCFWCRSPPESRP